MILCPSCQQPLPTGTAPSCPSCGMGPATRSGSFEPATQAIDGSPSATGATLEDMVRQLWGETLQPDLEGTVSLRRLPRLSQMHSPDTVQLRSLADDDHAGDYRLLEVLGEGGMGVVRAAWQTALERTIAVKLIRPHAAGNQQARVKFLSEALVTGDLDHPNIVPVFDLGRTEDGTLFYAMKRVQGVPWDRVLANRSQAENLEVLLRVCDAVAFAHSKGVIHRDLKPANVMLGDFGEVLVMDWGLAASVTSDGKAERLAQAGGGGTPAYMAPEMALRDAARIGFGSDVYLLGAILYQLLTGHPPHQAGSALLCLLSAGENRVEPPRQGGELADVAMKALATRPEDRFHCVKDFQAAIRECLAHSQSVALASAAEDDLAHAAQSGNYDDHARAVFGFEEALKLWPGNHAAARGRARARLDYAGRAHTRGDLDLAASLLSTDDPEHAALAATVAQARRERDTRQRRLKLLSRTAVALVAIVLVTQTVAFFLVRDSRDRAVEAEADAIQQKDNAVAAEKVAKEQKASAIEARDRAEYEAYVARVGLTAQLVEQSAYDQAIVQLESCPRELRNWEWGRLWYQCHRAERIIEHGARVSAVAVSPDGRKLALGYASHPSFYIHDAVTGRELLAIRTGPIWVRTLSFSPDGSRVLTTSSSGAASIWDCITGKELVHMKGHTTNLIHAGTYSRDGKHVLTGAHDNTVRLWDATTGKEVRVFLGMTGPVMSVALSPDGKTVCAGSETGSARLWNAETGETLHVLNGPPQSIYAVGFSLDGLRVFTAGGDRTMWLWDVASGKRLTSSAATSSPFNPPGHRELILAAAYSPSGDTILTGGSDNTVRLWDALLQVERRVLRGHSGSVTALAFVPGSNRVWTGSEDGTARAWDLETGEDRSAWSGNWGAVVSVGFSADGKTALIGGGDEIVRTRDVATGTVGPSLRVFAHEGIMHWVGFSADGKKMITCGADNAARVWDRETGREVLTLAGLTRLTEANFSPDGTKIITSRGVGLVQLWETADGKELRRFSPHGGESVASAIFSPDGKLVLSCGMDGTVRLSDAVSLQEVRVLKGHEKGVLHAVFSRDGQTILTGGQDHTARSWETDTGKMLQVFKGHEGGVQTVTFSPDGKRVLTASWDRTARLWDAQTGRELMRYGGHTAAVLGAAFSSDGKQVVTAGDRTVKLRDAETGQVTAELHRAGMGARWVGFAPDGKTLATACDQSVYVWPAERLREQWLTHIGVPRGVRLAPSPDGTFIATADSTARVRLWDARTYQPLRVFGPFESRVVCLAVSPDSRLVAVGSQTQVHLLEAGSGKRLWAVQDGDYAPNSIAFSPDGRQLLVANNDASARIRDVADGKERIRFDRHGWWVFAGAFSPDGKRVATGGEDQVVRVWDPATGEEQLVLKGHASGVRAVVFSPDGSRIVTASNDRAIKVWDARTGKELASLSGSRGLVRSLAFSRDGRNLLVGGRDFNAFLLPSAPWK